jgi:hypothetical protein
MPNIFLESSIDAWMWMSWSLKIVCSVSVREVGQNMVHTSRSCQPRSYLVMIGWQDLDVWTIFCPTSLTLTLHTIFRDQDIHIHASMDDSKKMLGIYTYPSGKI